MVNILKAARPLNLLIILVAQILTSYFLGFKNSWPIVFDLMHSSIYLTSILAAAFGYVFNDYMDVKADGINRPTAHYLANPTDRSRALFFAILSAALAIGIGFVYDPKLGLFISLVVTLLFFYSLLLKRIPLVGNFTIALLAGFSIFMLMAFDPNLIENLVIIFSINAFAIHFIREVVKDTEDMEGDRIAGYNTFPLLTGIKATRILIMFFLFLYILVFTICIRMMMVNYFTPPLSYVFLAYNILCVGWPLFHLLSKIQVAADKEDYTYMSSVARYVMITGTASMLLF